MAAKKKSPSTARPSRSTRASAAPSITVPAEPASLIVVAESAPVAAAPVDVPLVEPLVVVEPAVAVEVDAAPVAREPSHAMIARRAYELYRARGGDAFQNWIEAERELARR